MKTYLVAIVFLLGVTSTIRASDEGNTSFDEQTTPYDNLYESDGNDVAELGTAELPPFHRFICYARPLRHPGGLVRAVGFNRYQAAERALELCRREARFSRCVLVSCRPLGR